MGDTCAVCGTGVTRSYLNLEWEFGRQSYRLVQCATCGSASTSPLPDDQTLAELYASAFNYGWYRDHLPGKRLDSQSRLIEYRNRNLLGAKVLDYGGGLGYFSEVARLAGYQSATFDPFASASSLDHRDWDTVVAHHVLEHSNDLDRTLVQIKELLVPAGTFVVAVPNFLGLGYRTLGMRWVWAQPPLIHVHHFSAAGLVALLQRHGFENIEVSYHERWDANNYCDVKHARSFGFLGKLWGLPLLKRLAPYRRLAASIATALRIKGLHQSVANPASDPSDYSELQISAVAPH